MQIRFTAKSDIRTTPIRVQQNCVHAPPIQFHTPQPVSPFPYFAPRLCHLRFHIRRGVNEKRQNRRKFFKSRDITISAFWVLESGMIQKSRICHTEAFAEESHFGYTF